ncbi:MAG: FCD domain-containing protein [Pseudomonadota bacterium]|nr:FCD domain-containing protein [Pseudomonadota bacterium]
MYQLLDFFDNWFIIGLKESAMLQIGKSSKRGSADIATKLRREILNGTLKYRDKLPAERVLANFYGVARGTIRAALTMLEKEKYVQVRSGSGSFVCFEKSRGMLAQVENANPLEIIDARFAIEPHVCRLSTLYGKKEHFFKLAELNDKMNNSSNSLSEFSAADTLFHKTLAESTGNNLLIWIISQITEARGLPEWTKARNLTLNPEIIKLYNSQHFNILKHIRAREPELAASSMKAHLETARLSLTRAAGT